MKKIYFFATAVLLSFQMNAQDTNPAAKKKKNIYTQSVSELIFSWGKVEAAPLNPTSVVRFSCFFHVGQQLHVDFNEHTGFYTGLLLRNVGIINNLNDTVKIKQRVYTIGIPAAFKFGNMEGTYAAVGLEGEFAIAYKQKVFVNDEKSKTTIWFSDRTNIFLPSAFAEIRIRRGTFLKFKYYLTDFLRPGNQHVNVPGIVYTPTKSQMAFVSIGYAFRHWKSPQNYSQQPGPKI